MVDILLATYNGEKYLNDQILSIRNQSFTNWKLLIRDDNSSDKTSEVLKLHLAADNRIVLLNDCRGNLGVVRNFEVLLTQSRGEYIMFADQDDLWLPTKIQDSLDAMYEMESQFPNKPILIHTDVTVVDCNLNVLNASFLKSYNYDVTTTQSPNKLAVVNCVMGCTILMNKLSQKIVLPFSDSVLMHDWWIALNISYYGKIYFLDKSTSLYRQHSNNQVGAKSLSRGYYTKRLLALNDFFRTNWRFFKMIRSLPFRMNLFRVCFLKMCNTSTNFFISILHK